MDKYEYKVRSEEICNLINQKKYAEAADIADKIDWRRVKNITMLLRIAALYRENRRNEDARAILLITYGRYPTNRSVVQCLCEVSIELDDVVAAVEYYKEFVQLAPRDSGVYTLRYRILEAQEASLEERIELLEEFKKKDYQEEWIYELAYLYHRVGFATKCVEVCDEIILFFGDGAYVMKAMELKMLHAPLTAEQRAKYEVMSRNYNRNYSSEEPYNDSYDTEQGYAEDDYDRQQGYAETGYAQEQGYAETGYDGQQDYSDAYGYDNNAYNAEYNDAEYNNESYDNVNYQNADYSDNEYSNEDYSNENYSDENYSDENYSNESYSDENYPSESYASGSYQDETQQNGSYNSYAGEDSTVGDYLPQESGTAQEYTDEFYVDKFYNTDGLPIAAPTEAQPVETPSVEALSANTAAAMDMSQYNTINLERLVFDGMKEVNINDISSDSDADLEQEKSFETRTYVSTKERLENLLKEEKEEQAKEPKPSYTTGKVAAMVSNVSEESPKPDTGAIKKVIVPGEDARFIKKDVDMTSLRDTTEQSVNDEQKRMQENAENVYLEREQQPVKAAGSDDAQEQFRPMTGQMNLEDVLAEWEQIKQENVQKNQEAIKKRVIHQTGKIIANFDNSVKDEISDGFEERAAEEEPRTRLEELVADELGGSTAEMPNTQVSEALVEIEEVEDNAEEDAEYTDGEEEYTFNEDVQEEPDEEYSDEDYTQEEYTDSEEYTDETAYEEDEEETADNYQEDEDVKEQLDPDDEESIAEMAKEDALKTQEIKMNTAELGGLSDKILAATRKEANGAKPEEIRSFSPEEQQLFENFAVTKKIKKQIIFALDKMTLAAYTGNVIITGEAGLDTLKLAKNLVKEFQAIDANFSGKVAKITGEKLNSRNLKEVFDKLNNGAIIIEKANGMTEQKLYEMTTFLNQESLGIIVIMEDTKKEITKLLEKQAMITDYFNIRIDLMEMDSKALVAYAKNYALALEYSIDDMGTLALYTRISNMQGGNPARCNP